MRSTAQRIIINSELTSEETITMVVALAGRRIDVPNTNVSRFPLLNVALVQKRIQKLFVESNITELVCAAACGSDLIALQVAGELEIRRRVVLPFEPERFRTLSVTDRPGEWGPIFDRVIQEVQARGDLVALNSTEDEEVAFFTTNIAILEEALALVNHPDKVIAIIVWEGKARGKDDMTAAFAREARKRKIMITEVLTL